MEKSWQNLGYQVNDLIELTGSMLSIDQVSKVSKGGQVTVSSQAIERVKSARRSVEESVSSGEVIYGVNTGFGNNADIVVDNLEATERLQKNLLLTHAVCIGAPLSLEVVRAMMVIRVNTLLRGHSGIRWVLLARLIEMLNEGMTPIIPEKGSVGASGDLAPLSHMALPLIGAGEVLYKGERYASAEALTMLPSVHNHSNQQLFFKLSYKEGLALINGTTLMTAYGVLAIDRLSQLIDLADVNGALALEAICGRSAAFRADVHQLRPHPGQIQSALHIRGLVAGSTMVDIEASHIPTSKGSWRIERRANQLMFSGGKSRRPQDSYSIRCIPQVHGALRDVVSQAQRVIDIELNSVTDNPLLFPELPVEERFASAGHFHGMPVALALSYLKVAIPSLASISERRINKLVDPATNDGLPAFLVTNLEGTDSGFMIIQYTAASLVNDLASRAHPTTVYSIPTSANTEDHVSMGANEGRHVYEMLDDLSRVLALELMTNTQAMELRYKILQGQCLTEYALDEPEEIKAHRALMVSKAYEPSPHSKRVLEVVRSLTCFLEKDRELSPEINRVCDVVMNDPQQFIQPLNT